MKRGQKAVVSIVLVLGVLLSTAITATIGWRPILGPRARPLTNRRFEPTPARLARGAYLTKGVTPCLVCHSESVPNEFGVPKTGTEGAGQPWFESDLSWLTVPNITPDPETGAGNWSDDALARAIREGIGHDGRTLFPVMPYVRLHAMSDEDVAAVVSYIRTLPPVRKQVAPSAVPFPVNRLINSAPQPIEGSVPEPDRSTPEKRGQYIATVAACEECHTPRDSHDQAMEDMAFAGGNVLKVQGRAPVAAMNLTPSPAGIPYYTPEMFVEAMRTGHAAGRQLSDVMPWRFYRNMTDADLRDLFAYLKTLKPVDHFVDNSLPPTRCPRCGHEHGGGERNSKPS
jgi:mono/diheme cytochrome c family protein